jgi:signal transduction histidine kinase
VRYLSKQFTRFIKLLALGSMLVLSLATPFTYFFLEYQDENERAAYYARKYALKLQQAIQENPEYWQLSVEKFIEVFADIQGGDVVEAIEVYDNELRLLHRETLLEPAMLSIHQTAQIRYNNKLYGSVIIYGNLAYIISNTIILLCLFSIMTFIVVKLHNTNQKSQNEIVSQKEIERMLRMSREELREKNRELTRALEIITHTQNQLIQQEKLAGIGQLAAGVAHEINNPLGFVTGNVEMLEEYFIALRSVLAQYRELRSDFGTIEQLPLKDKIDRVIRNEMDKDLDFILDDLPELLGDTVEGLNRITKIVKGMRLFSRIDQQRVYEQYDLIKGLHSALLMANNEIKHYARVEEWLEDIPAIEAVGGEINQVLLNLIVNAAQAVKAKENGETGVIKISIWHDEEFVYCAIEDSGVGIMPENLKNIFNPFFTTKTVGQGTGMGLSISYDIIVNRHNGEILVESSQGNGATFTVKLPISHDRARKIEDKDEDADE